MLHKHLIKNDYQVIQYMLKFIDISFRKSVSLFFHSVNIYLFIYLCLVLFLLLLILLLIMEATFHLYFNFNFFKQKLELELMTLRLSCALPAEPVKYPWNLHFKGMR